MRALVLGGHGAVGSVVAVELGALGHEAVPTGRSAGPDGLRIDLRTPQGVGALTAAATDHDVVVNASGVEDVAVRQACAATPFVDMSASGAYLDRLAAVAVPTTTVLGAGLAPGLTIALIAALVTRAGDEVDVAIVSPPSVWVSSDGCHCFVLCSIVPLISATTTAVYWSSIG
ncbi:hypothetical protein QSJ19_18860 [Gordonia sp. ABSL11-1]|uniref:hypothetical protein n=1 Tax=Gordonia sp. ABSL11-1 TaxID=3053924 RepID=UPI0025745122|nr:hypothetical protein [Gordonia sp. ABSL11-1]MDL9947605.1 hypothetical protein [Gordonia sp. ABSL11-1]